MAIGKPIGMRAVKSAQRQYTGEWGQSEEHLICKSTASHHSPSAYWLQISPWKIVWLTMGYTYTVHKRSKHPPVSLPGEQLRILTCRREQYLNVNVPIAIYK